MTLAYIDCFSGISGDMILGALVDAGVGIDVLRSELEKLNLPGYEITALKVTRSGIAATKVHVCLAGSEQPSRHLPDIRTIIQSSSLSATVKEKSLAVFSRLAEAEAKVHGTDVDKVHFHEVGAVDAMVDIVGSMIGLELLGIMEIRASPINLGSGTVATAHGVLPVPAPATVELLKGIPAYGSAVPFELATPTGAAILTCVSSSFGPVPGMKIRNIAHGAGGKDIPGQPNVLRLLIGEPAAAYDEDTSVLIETNIDDLNPQVYGYLIETLLLRGAQDAYLTPILMKKGRPGILLSVLADRTLSDAMLDIVFRETTSIGVRITEVGRKKLSREIVLVRTIYGDIRIKISKREGEVLTATPEYEDCRAAAEARQVPLKTVIEEAKRCLREQACGPIPDGGNHP